MSFRKKYCVHCKTVLGKSKYYEHLHECFPTEVYAEEGSTSSRAAGKFYCEHCKRLVSKSTFYDHKTLYGNGLVEETLPDLPAHSGNQDVNVVVQHSADVLKSYPYPAMSSRTERDDIEHADSNEEEDGEDDHVSDDQQLEEEDLRFFGSSEEEEDEEERQQPQVDQDDDEQLAPELFTSNDVERDSSEEQERVRQLPTTKALLLFLLLWQSVYKVSDRALLILVRFMGTFLVWLGNIVDADAVVKFAMFVPNTIYKIHQAISFDKDDFDQLPSCPECKTLYHTDECVVTRINNERESAKCSHKKWPLHPQLPRRRQCGTALMKSVSSRAGRKGFQPKEVFCYKQLTVSIQEAILTPGFIEKCNKWKERSVASDVYGDIYDGRIWKEFLEVDGEPFLSSSLGLGVMLNVDWFKATVHGSETIGVIYLVILNLPRAERFKFENLIIIGIIPGPKEPKLTINPFIQPMVDELVDLWEGVLMDTISGSKELVRVALLAISCDLPAGRKCGGFMGHNARRGCHKCYKEFTRESFNDKPDFSGFDRSKWPARSNERHRADAEKVRWARTPTQAKAIASATGARYSVLLQLPYYHAVRFFPIDPMHNLLLGTAKHVITTWLSMGILNDKKLKRLQTRIDTIKVPSECGRLPGKIANAFQGFTADQWKNVLCIFSIFALRGLVPTKHYNMWVDFATACRLLCRTTISEDDCTEADDRLMEFCRKFEGLCGKERCTPNMHLHGHLVDCIRDYGPVFAFWCFSFERYNGILGSYHTNNVNIGVQMMRKFLRDKYVRNAPFPEELEQFRYLLDDSNRQRGTLGLSNFDEDEPHKTEQVLPLPPIVKKALDSLSVKRLTEMYQRLYAEDKVLHVSSFCEKFKRLVFEGNSYKCQATVQSKWLDGTLRPAFVEELMSHEVTIEKSNDKVLRLSQVVARVEWYAKHPRYQDRYGNPVEVWSIDFDDDDSAVHAYYLPFQLVECSCVAFRYAVPLLRSQKETVQIVIPLPKRTEI